MNKADEAVRTIAKSKGVDLTPAKRKLINAAYEIVSGESVSKAFLASQLVQCTLPHTDPGPVELWTRTNGNVTLGVRSGIDISTKQRIGIPYGVIPRLLLFWINTEAVRTKNRRLELGPNLSTFMTALGLDPSRGGVRSDAARLRDQMARLFRATISFQQKGIGKDPSRFMDMRVAFAGEFNWWDPKHATQSSLWSEWIMLSEELFESITAAPVPVQLEALRALRKSPLALDLYAWATHKAFSVSRRGEAQYVPWDGLLQQLGAEYSDVKNFKKNANDAFKKIQLVYPGLKLQRESGGFLVLPTSRTAIE